MIQGLTFTAVYYKAHADHSESLIRALNPHLANIIRIAVSFQKKKKKKDPLLLVSQLCSPRHSRGTAALETDSSFIHSLNYVTFIQSSRLHLITPGDSERKGDSISIINPTSHRLLSCFSYPNVYRSHILTTSVQLVTGFQVCGLQEKT